MNIKTTFPWKSTWLDYPDNESLAILINFIGCSHFCEKCQNSKLEETEKLKEFNLTTFGRYLLKMNKELNTNKVVFSGGDPLYEKNIEFIKSFLDLLNYTSEKFDICIYTGYNIDQVKEFNLPKTFKYLKCGKYIHEQNQPSYKSDDRMQFASTNQKLYDSNYNLISNNIGRYTFKKE